MRARHKKTIRRSKLKNRQAAKERRNKHLRKMGCDTVYIDPEPDPLPQKPKRLSEMTKDEIFEAWMKEPIRGPMERALRLAFVGRSHPK